MRILVLDIETTGFSPEKNSIVEIGMVLLDTKTGQAKLVFDEIVKDDNLAGAPEIHEKAWIFSNSDLTFEMVCEATDLESYRAIIQAWLDIFRVTAWNSPFDFSFMSNRHFQFKALPDPMRIATNIMKLPKKNGGYKWPKVEEAYLWYMPVKHYTEKHRAGQDAMDEARIIYEMIYRGDYNVS